MGSHSVGHVCFQFSYIVTVIFISFYIFIIFSKYSVLHCFRSNLLKIQERLEGLQMTSGVKIGARENKI